MTPRQKELARHALGLKDRRKVSYRNHFVAGKGHPDYADWDEMVVLGLATRFLAKAAIIGGDDYFKLTRAGAQAALNKGERLDKEDFPA